MSEARITNRHGKTVHSITGKDGKALPAYSALDWFVKDGTECQGFGDGPVFSQPHAGNHVEFYPNGKSYFKAVAEAIEGAKKCVFIAGWQINFDVILTGEKRLFDCLLKAVENGASVYVMPWMSPKVGVDTGDFDTMLAVFQLNAGMDGAPKAFCMPAVQQSDMGALGIGFAHHQKLVVVDNKTAFVGGIDLAYGRREDETFSLIANSDGRKGCEMYNACIPALYELQSEKQAEYLTRAELFSASFNILTAAQKSKERIGANIRDRLGFDEFKEWWAEETIFTRWMNSLTQKGTETATEVAVDSAAWAFNKLPADVKQALGQMIISGAGDIKGGAGVLLAWMNNRTLDSLPMEVRTQAEAVLKVLVMRCYQALNATSDNLPFRYPFLTGGRTMLPPGAKTLDPAKQPRMPWQDVQSKVEGPSVYDLSQNFVRRWNSIQYRMSTPAKYLAEEGGAAMPDVLRSFLRAVDAPLKIKPRYIQVAHLPIRTKAQSGKCTVQVLRSAPSRLRKDEYGALSFAQKREEASREPALPKPELGLPAQDNCLKATINVIGRAQKFIYIEGQFFQSEHGDSMGFPVNVPSGPTGWMSSFTHIPGYEKYNKFLNLSQAAVSANPNRVIRWENIPKVLKDKEFPEFIAGLRRVLSNQALIQGTLALKQPQEKLLNPIGLALSERIERAIFEEEAFHVYMVLPVHPEGPLNVINIMTQVHLTMQSLVFGEKSLVNRIRRSIKVKELIKTKKLSLEAARSEVNKLTLKQLSDVVGNHWQEYLTLLNLRNWETIGGRPVTEQIYVHSKLLIADDRVAVLGSANINDRSMLGNRDSEIAIIVRDGVEVKIDIDGKGKQHPVSKAVHKLRTDLWKNYFGLSGKVRPASDLAECIDKPADPQTWKKIQTRANDNAAAYYEAFSHIPRNRSPMQSTEASLWPSWKYPDPLPGQEVVKTKGAQQGAMPFEETFWTKGKAGVAPTGVQGYIVALPIQWTAGENNNSGINLTLVAENGADDLLLPNNANANV